MYHQHKSYKCSNRLQRRWQPKDKQCRKTENRAEGEINWLFSCFYTHCVCMPVQALHAFPRGKSASGGGKTCSSCFFCLRSGGGVSRQEKRTWQFQCVQLCVRWNPLQSQHTLEWNRNLPSQHQMVQFFIFLHDVKLIKAPFPPSYRFFFFSFLNISGWSPWM